MVKRWLKFRVWISKENKWKEINIWLVAKNSSVDYIIQVERKPGTKSHEWPIFKVQKKKNIQLVLPYLQVHFPWFQSPMVNTVQKQMILRHILRMSTVACYYNANIISLTSSHHIGILSSLYHKKDKYITISYSERETIYIKFLLWYIV